MTNLSQALGQKAMYVSSNKYLAVSKWAAGHAYSIGDVVRPSGQSNLTFTQANPGVFTWKDNSGTAVAHNFVNNERMVFTNNGDTLPTNLAFNTPYWVRNPSGNTFNLSATWNGSSIDTTAGSQAGTHLATANYAGPEYRQFCYICITAGTSAATLEPLWPTHIDNNTTRGNTISDGGVTWMEATGLPILNGDLTHTPTWVTGSKNDGGYQCYGQVITDVAQTHVFICLTNSVAGGTGAEPTWNVAAVGNTTADSSQSWEYIGTVASWQARKWAAPWCAMIDGMQSGWGDGTNNGTQMYFIGASHHEYNDTRNWSWNSYSNRSNYNSPCYVICISESGNIPPTLSDLSTGAVFETNSNISWNPQYWCYTYGCEIRCTTNNSGIWISYVGSVYYEKCIFNNSYSSGANMLCYQTAELKNCQFKFGSVNQCLYNSGSGMLRWHNDDPTLPGFLSGTVASSIGLFFVAGGGGMEIVGVDLATNQSGTTKVARGDGSGFGDVTFRNCKIPSGNSVDITKFQSYQGVRYRLINCNNGALFNYCETADYRGYMVTDEVAYRTGGASIGGAAFSWNFTSQYSTDSDVWYSLPITALNTQISGTLTATIYGCCVGAIPTDQELWLDIDFLGSTSSPQSTGFTGRNKPLPITSPNSQTADSTSIWTGAAGSRGNSTAYVLGNELSVASSGSVNRLFVCTTAGTSSGSLPGAYATAVDGTAVTDGGAVFTAVTRFKLVASLTTHPLTAGPVNAVIRQSGGKVVATKSYWFDPVLNLS